MPLSQRTQLFQTLSVLFFILISLLFAYESWLSRPWSWLIVLGALLAFFLVLGIWITHQPLGVLINERNLMSLSRLQIVSWSLVIFSGYLVAVMQRIAGHVPNPLNVSVDNHLGAILGISSSLMSLSLGAPQVMRLFAPLVFQAAIPSMPGSAATLPFDALLDVAVLQGTNAADPSQPPPQDQTLLRQRVTNFD